MSELDQLKKRIFESGEDGIETAHIRDDYEPAGDMMINVLTESGKFVSRRVMDDNGIDSRWKIFPNGLEPY